MLTYKAKHESPITEPEELVYDPSASIVYLWTENGQTVAKTMSADVVTTLETARKNNLEHRIKLQNQLDKLKEYLNENYDDLELHADEIAEIMGIDLTRTIELEMSATFTVTVELGRDQDPSDIDAYDFNVEISSYTYDIENDDVTAIHIDDYNEL